MASIPRDAAPDATLPFRRDPYRFISSRSRKHGADFFQTRLLLKPAICLTGAEAAKVFYDESRFTRVGAPPTRIQASLFGRGGVQTMDGEAHRHRKRMLMSFMTPDSIRDLVSRIESALREDATRWGSQGRVDVYEAAQKALTRAVCSWAGVPLPESEFDTRRRDIVALFDGAGAIGPRHWRARLSRARADLWIAGLVRDHRSGASPAPEGSPLAIIAEHRDHEGKALSPRTAAVSVLNLVRPTVALSVWIVWLVVAMHERPEWRARVAEGSDEEVERFVQEVRRFYPFFPAVGARVRQDFEWRGARFPKHRLVLLDLYGVNHDPRVWKNPETFNPDRFLEWDGSPYNFIPQGGGDFIENHRCVGEWLTIATLKAVSRFFARDIRWTLVATDLRPQWSRLPSLPRGQVALTSVATPSDAAEGRLGTSP